MAYGTRHQLVLWFVLADCGTGTASDGMGSDGIEQRDR